MVAAVTMLVGPVEAQEHPEDPPAGQPSRAAPGAHGMLYEGDPTAHVHDGFFLRMHVGPAGFATSTSAGGDTIRISGSGGGFALAVGGAINPRVVLYGEIFADVAVGPTLEVNGQSASTSDEVSAGVAGFGPGIAYYSPSNVYVSGTLALAEIRIEEDGREVGSSEFGLGVSAAVGKEWWVSPQWGLGAAGQLFVGSMADGSADATWTTVGLMLAFSATLN